MNNIWPPNFRIVNFLWWTCLSVLLLPTPAFACLPAGIPDSFDEAKLKDADVVFIGTVIGSGDKTYSSKYRIQKAIKGVEEEAVYTAEGFSYCDSPEIGELRLVIHRPLPAICTDDPAHLDRKNAVTAKNDEGWRLYCDTLKDEQYLLRRASGKVLESAKFLNQIKEVFKYDVVPASPPSPPPQPSSNSQLKEPEDWLSKRLRN